MRCDATLASCICEVTGDHEVHECSCGGSWKGKDGDEEVVTFPSVPDDVLFDVFLTASIRAIRGRISYPSFDQAE